MAAAKVKAWPKVLQFVASLVFLYVIFVGRPTEGWSLSALGAASWLAPLLYAAAVLSTIALFFISLVGLGWSGKSIPEAGGKMMPMMASKSLGIAGFTLLVLTVFISLSITGATAMWSWLVIIGYIVGWLGVGMEYV